MGSTRRSKEELLYDNGPEVVPYRVADGGFMDILDRYSCPLHTYVCACGSLVGHLLEATNGTMDAV